MNNTNQSDPDYINVKIEPKILKTLLKKKALLVQHLHCNDMQSKTAIQQLLLDITLKPVR